MLGMLSAAFRGIRGGQGESLGVGGLGRLGVMEALDMKNHRVLRTVGAKPRRLEPFGEALLPVR